MAILSPATSIRRRRIFSAFSPVPPPSPGSFEKAQSREEKASPGHGWVPHYVLPPEFFQSFRLPEGDREKGTAAVIHSQRVTVPRGVRRRKYEFFFAGEKGLRSDLPDEGRNRSDHPGAGPDPQRGGPGREGSGLCRAPWEERWRSSAAPADSTPVSPPISTWRQPAPVPGRAGFTGSMNTWKSPPWSRWRRGLRLPFCGGAGRGSDGVSGNSVSVSERNFLTDTTTDTDTLFLTFVT